MRFASPLVPGRLVQRYKRFLADVILDSGEAVTAHCANPGSMLGLNAPGNRVWLSRSADPKRKLVTLEWNADDCIDVQASLFRGDEEPYDFMDMPRQQQFCMNAHKVMIGDRLIGAATSRGFSYTFRRMLSHGVIDVVHAAPGTEVTVIWGDPGSRQKQIRAIVARSPYKADNRRADLAAMPLRMEATSQ